MRERPAARIYRTLSLIQNSRNGLHIDQLAHGLDCNPRTVRRILHAMQDEMNVPLYSEKTERGTVWKIDPSWRNATPILLSQQEMEALILARKSLERNGEENHVTQALDELIQKLKSQRSEEFRRRVEMVDYSIIKGADDLNPAMGFIPHFDLVMEAIQRRRKLCFDYTNHEGRETRKRLVAPLVFCLSEGRVYLAAYCYLREALRSFVPAKMKNVKISEKLITEEIVFDRKEYAQSSLGGFYAEPQEVVLKLSPWMTEYFTRNVSHPTQQLFQKSRRHYLRFRVGISWALVWWISRFGPNVEVIKPVDLREWVYGYLDAATRLYE